MINYKKQKKNVFLKEGEIIAKNNAIYANNQLIDQYVSAIFVSGSGNISAKAVAMLSQLRCPIFFSYKNKIISISNSGGNAKLKRQQSAMIIQKPKKIQKNLIKLRNCVLKAMNYPTIEFSNNLLLEEARIIKRVYQIASKRAGIKWDGKLKTGNTTALHSWWIALYTEITACVLKMGLDPDLGAIHRCNNGFIYDIADILKPLLIEAALKSQPYDISSFYIFFKKLRFQSLIPQLIFHVLSYKTKSCYWPRSHPCRELCHTLSTSILVPPDLSSL